jgi:hypothetical protein
LEFEFPRTFPGLSIGSSSSIFFVAFTGALAFEVAAPVVAVLDVAAGFANALAIVAFAGTGGFASGFVVGFPGCCQVQKFSFPRHFACFRKGELTALPLAISKPPVIVPYVSELLYPGIARNLTVELR